MVNEHKSEQIAHNHICRMPKRHVSDSFINKEEERLGHCTGGVTCHGRNADECNLTRSRAEMTCVMENKLRELGYDPMLLVDDYFRYLAKWPEEIQ